MHGSRDARSALEEVVLVRNLSFKHLDLLPVLVLLALGVLDKFPGAVNLALQQVYGSLVLLREPDSRLHPRRIVHNRII